MPHNNQPSVFISSTIYDFGDLRSALKYWLVERGCSPLMSEYNDFPKALESNSYESCLAAIRSSDYFLLLVGGRVGGWFDEASRVSITRQEYREALRSFETTGKPRIAVFVRQNVWDVREDRNALQKFLASDDELSRGISDAAKARIANHPSKVVADAEAVAGFLAEIGRIDDMKNAQKGTTALPKANWIHRFSTFEDIVSALVVSFRLARSAQTKILVSNLENEMLDNLVRLHAKMSDDVIVPLGNLMKSTCAALTPGFDGDTVLNDSNWTRTAMYITVASSVHNQLTTNHVEEAIKQGVFMRYDVKSSRYITTPLHDRLVELSSQIRRLTQFPLAGTELMAEFGDRRRRAGNSVRIPNIQLIPICGHALLLEWLTETQIFLLSALRGDEKAISRIKPPSSSPFPDEAEKIERGRLSRDELVRYWDQMKKSSKS
jgi:hypothetical protein